MKWKLAIIVAAILAVWYWAKTTKPLNWTGKNRATETNF